MTTDKDLQEYFRDEYNDEVSELKKELAEVIADKEHLISAAMDGGDKYHYTAHDIGYRNLESKCKVLEADYVISNRELLILQQRISELEAERKWIPMSSSQRPEQGQLLLVINKNTLEVTSWYYDKRIDMNIHMKHFTHWMPLPKPPETE